jgi:hypothetical protein
MTSTLAAHIGELAESLQDLRRRVRQAARYEVARAVGEALRDAAMSLVCGPASAMPRHGHSAWDDPWDDPAVDSWQRSSYGDTIDAERMPRADVLRVSPAVLAGFGAARWSYTRSRQIGPAILIGLLVAIAATLGGPSVKALLKAWSVANDLLSSSDSDRGF